MSSHLDVDLPPLPQNKPPPITTVIEDYSTALLKNNLIKVFLVSFLKRRPQYEQLKREGIIKGYL
jgi:hypothetical protein